MDTKRVALSDEDIVRLLTEGEDRFVYIGSDGGMYNSYVDDKDLTKLAIGTVRKILKEHDAKRSGLSLEASRDVS